MQKEKMRLRDEFSENDSYLINNRKMSDN